MSSEALAFMLWSWGLIAILAVLSISTILKHSKKN